MKNAMRELPWFSAATFGFVVQYTQWDAVLKIIIGLLTVLVLAVKLGILVTRNWEALAHPRRYIEKRRRIKANQMETTTS